MNFNPQAEAWAPDFQRTIRRKNEENLWTGWRRNQGLFNLVSAGRIEGIHDVTQGHGLDVKPYMIGTHTQTMTGVPTSNYKGDGGVDFFYNITPQLKMNLTVNTDFAQTEVDDRQVNLTRFPLFFPEKRDFFLEGSGNFDFSRERFNNLTAFFSRRIGLTDRGQPQKIDYGSKITGRLAGYDVGFMQVRTGDDRRRTRRRFHSLSTQTLISAPIVCGLIYTRRATRNSNIPVRQTIGGDFQLATTHFRGLAKPAVRRLHHEDTECSQER